MSLGWAQLLVLLVALQRLGELALARRNSKRLLAEGGEEVGAGHYPLFILLQGSWLAALFFLVPAERMPDWGLLSLFLVMQAGRVWVIASLGRFWTTRIITLAKAPLVRRGPYRFLRHPNYVIVVAEIALLPLAFAALWICLIFSLLNAALLFWRIRVEDRALAGRASS